MIKKILCIRTLVLSFGFIALIQNSLFAGPVYAAQWKKGEQMVCVYGDIHSTHEVLGEKYEVELAKEFLDTLIHSKQKILFLLEDVTSHLEELGNIEASSQGFIWEFNTRLLSINKEKTSLHLFVESTDFRAGLAKKCRVFFELLTAQHNLFSFYKKKLKKYNEKEIETFKKNLEQTFALLYTDMKKTMSINKIENICINEILQQPTIFLKNLIEKTDDKDTAEILLKIQKRYEERYKVARAVLAENCTIEEFLVLTPSMFYNKFTFEHLFNYFINGKDEKGIGRYLYLATICRSIVSSYMSDTVEAYALWCITQKKKIHKRNIIVTGISHIIQLEEFLVKLGYKRIKCDGEPMREFITKINHSQLQILKNNILHHKLSIFGDENDFWCLKFNTFLYYNKNIPFPEIDELPIKQYGLISPKAFNWINESDGEVTDFFKQGISSIAAAACEIFASIKKALKIF